MARDYESMCENLNNGVLGTIVISYKDVVINGVAVAKGQQIKIIDFEFSEEYVNGDSDEYLLGLSVDCGPTVFVSNLEFVRLFKDKFDSIEFWRPARKFPLDLDRPVYFLHEGRVKKGVIVREFPRPSEYKIEFKNSDGEKQRVNVPKNCAGAEMDHCTVVRDYRMDPSGNTLRLDYSEECIFEHRPLRRYTVDDTNGFYNLF